MAKRIQEQKGERIVSKSRPVMNVSSYLTATCCSAASSPIASKSPGMSGASGKSSFDAASASKVRLKDAYLGGLREEQQGNLSHGKDRISEESDDSESEPWNYKPVAQNKEACGKPLKIRKRHGTTVFNYRYPHQMGPRVSSDGTSCFTGQDLFENPTPLF